MREHEDKNEKDVEEQPPFLKELLSTMKMARRQSSLYGTDHKSSEEFVENFKNAVNSAVRKTGDCTLVFTKERLVVNDHCYASSSDAEDLFERLRGRGGMAVSFIESPSRLEIAAFINFLNAEPSDIRDSGGPSAYLDERHVQSITVTDAVYAGRGVSDLPRCALSDVAVDPVLMDSAVQALIERYCDQPVEGDQEDIPLDEILRSPEATAKLIWESVMKLHEDGPRQTVGELGFQVIQNLKQMASQEKAAWDLSTAQIRKAVSDLPLDVRTASFGFLSEAPSILRQSSRVRDISELEAMIANESDHLDSQVDLDQLFDVRTTGLLSTWQKELQPESIMACSARTFATLMMWETDCAEHQRLAKAIAVTISRGLGSNDTRTAMSAAESLLREVNLSNGPTWRSANAKAALQGVGLPSLETLVERAVESRTLPDVTAALIEAVPALALNLARFLRPGDHQAVKDSIKRGIAKSGTAASPVLRELLLQDSPSAREAALETLISIGTDWSVREIAEAMLTLDDDFIIKSLDMLPQIHTMTATQTCVYYVRHKSLAVRIAALQALGRAADPLGMPSLVQAAVRRRNSAEERIVAIESLGRFNHPDAISCLKAISVRRPLFGRARYKPIKEAALSALEALEGAPDED